MIATRMPQASLFSDLDVEDVNNLRQRGKQAHSLITEYAISGVNSRRDGNADAFDIATAYHELYELYGSDTDIAVRSATHEDFPNASFADQQETYFKVSGIKENGVITYFIEVKAQL